MANAAKIYIPLKSYLRKYLEKKYGNVHEVTRKSWLGQYVIDILDTTYRKNGISLNYDNTYCLAISHRVIQRHGFEISPEKLKKFETMIEKVFRSELFTYAELSVANNLTYENNGKVSKQFVNKSFEQSFKHYGITESDLKLETLYRDYLRFKEEKKLEEANNRQEKMHFN